ncbi:MAG: His/Gly/Thr/Pro-type tRNA ligase C-terminal domain-containing protein, partial [Candidatus Aenigmatarchaeota archaeon]
RTREFLWQEGHTAHATYEEAEEEVMLRLNQYKKLIEEYLAIPVIAGKKSDGEKFAGALYTTTLEGLMGDKKALQMATSHHLGQHFAKAFDIKFLDKDSTEKYVWQTSWGISTRLIGAIVMVHGDDKGLILPPRIAPIHIVIIPIGFEKNKKILNKAREIKSKLEKHYSVEIDEREYTPGWKFNDWELKGVPVRIEIGPRDVENNQVTIFRRDKMLRETVKEKSLERTVKILMDDIQKSLFDRAKKFLEENTFEVNTFSGFKEVVEKGGFVKAKWCGDLSCEKKIKEETAATVRVLPFVEEDIKGRCVFCERDAKYVAYFAKSY